MAGVLKALGFGKSGPLQAKVDALKTKVAAKSTKEFIEKLAKALTYEGFNAQLMVYTLFSKIGDKDEAKWVVTALLVLYVMCGSNAARNATRKRADRQIAAATLQIYTLAKCVKSPRTSNDITLPRLGAVFWNGLQYVRTVIGEDGLGDPWAVGGRVEDRDVCLQGLNDTADKTALAFAIKMEERTRGKQLDEDQKKAVELRQSQFKKIAIAGRAALPVKVEGVIQNDTQYEQYITAWWQWYQQNKSKLEQIMTVKLRNARVPEETPVIEEEEEDEGQQEETKKPEKQAKTGGGKGEDEGQGAGLGQ